MTDDLPPALKRDKNNVAPFMRVGADARNMPPINLATSPPASPPNWAPPWLTKSDFPDA